MAKGERVHDPSAVRGKLSESEGGIEPKRGRETKKKKRIAIGRSHLLVNKE